MNVPPGTPAQPLLILDVERCCLGMTHTAADGWRYYKRPGLDTFLKQLEQYYEIVLHHETEAAVDATAHLIQSSGQFIHLLTNSGIGLPTDLWVPATKKIKP